MTRRVERTYRIGPQDVIRVIELLERDRDASISGLRERDRAISIELEAANDLEKVLGWTRARGGKELGGTWFDRVCTGCMLAGAASGLLFALGAFFYDGASRINVLAIVLFFVVLPLATLVWFAATAARESTPMVNPGWLGHVIAGIVHGEHHPVTRMFEGQQGQQGQGIPKWLILLWWQWFALGHSITATVTAFTLIVSTDLAFGWSTTLDLTSATFEHWLHLVAAPWSWVLPAAVPDSDLVEISRYFRLDAVSQDAVDPVLLGRWWPFVIVAMTVYGVVPRLAMLWLCQSRLRSACESAILDHSRELLDRMKAPLVDTRAATRDAHESGDIPPQAATMDADASLPPAEAWTAVNWAEVPVPDDVLRAAFRDATTARVDGPEHAGGARSVNEDLSLVDALGERATGVVIFAKAWEPPLLELGDFVTDLCNRVDVDQPVVVLPIRVESGSVAVISEDAFESWRRSLGRNVPARVAIARLRDAFSG